MPTRTCVGCRQRDEKSALVRVVRSSNGVVVDDRQILDGRGAYVHAACFELAQQRKAFNRALPAQSLR